MNQKRTTKQALVFSVLSLMLCFCMLIGSTFAWFTDSVSSEKNTIVAGNLDIELEYYKNGAWTTVEGKSDLFDPAAKWEPGHVEVVYLKASNLGNLALKYILSVNLTGEVAGTNVNGEEFKLSDYLMFDIVKDINPETAAFADRAAAIAATSNAKTLQESLIGNINDDGLVRDELTAADATATTDEKYVAVVIWMPTDLDKEVNPLTGTRAPSIDIGVSIAATQLVAEEDGFGPDYDADAVIPNFGSGSYTLTGAESAFTFEVRGTENQKLGSFTVPSDAVASASESVKGTITEVPARTGNFDIQAGQTMKSYEVEVTNIKDGNTDKITVKLRIAGADTWINEDELVILHEGVAIPEEDLISYDPNSGYVTFKTATFSPFDVIFEVIDTPTLEGNPDDLPEAELIKDVDTYVGKTITWESYGGITPDFSIDEDPKLEAVYTFKAPEGASESIYADWYCDFYVSLDRDLEANQILLAGNYGEFGWIGFHNGNLTVEKDTEVPLLGSVGNPWTYESIANGVGTFICGVGDVNNALSGATFTVKLRLTNPQTVDTDAVEFYDVATVRYTFE